MKNSKSLLLFLFIAMCSMFTYSGCTKKHSGDTEQPPASSEAFTVAVGVDKYVVDNENIDEPVAIQARGPGDVTVAVNYLNAVADCTGGVLKIVTAMKGQKLTTFQVWVNIVPVLISEIKGIIQSGKQLKKFTELYSASQGLTIVERAAVAESFAARFSIPYSDAEELTEILVEVAFSGMNAAGKIQTLTKK